MKSTSDRRVAGSSYRQSLLRCRVMSTLDSFRKLSKTCPWFCLWLLHLVVGFLFIHSIVAIASYIRNWLFVSRGCGYARANHSTGLPYDKFIITIVKCNTGKYHEFISEYCYKCVLLYGIYSGTSELWTPQDHTKLPCVWKLSMYECSLSAERPWNIEEWAEVFNSFTLVSPDRLFSEGNLY